MDTHQSGKKQDLVGIRGPEGEKKDTFPQLKQKNIKNSIDKRMYILYI
jgi:hypothetical protein